MVTLAMGGADGGVRILWRWPALGALWGQGGGHWWVLMLCH